ncbi:MAG: hypothetical protein V1850_07380 [Candidatus Bathyarchaeota archaeon]
MPLKIVLDSNFFFIPVQFHIDIFSEMERITDRKIENVLLSPVYEELKALSMKDGMKGRHAKMALNYAEKLKIINCETKSGETVDDLILRTAAECRYPVATNDRMLRRRLKDIDITVIYLRKKSHLEVDGNIMKV